MENSVPFFLFTPFPMEDKQQTAWLMSVSKSENIKIPNMTRISDHLDIVTRCWRGGKVNSNLTHFQVTPKTMNSTLMYSILDDFHP